MRKFDVAPWIKGSTKLTCPVNAEIDGVPSLFTVSTDDAGAVNVNDLAALRALFGSMGTVSVKQAGTVTAFDPVTGKPKKPTISGTMTGSVVATMLETDREYTLRIAAVEAAARKAEDKTADAVAMTAEPSEVVPAAADRLNGNGRKKQTAAK